MKVWSVLVILCLCVVFKNAVSKKVKSENIEDTYGDLLDEDVQNDEDEYGTGDDEGPAEEDNETVAAEEHVEFKTHSKLFLAKIGDTLKLPCEVSNPDIITIWQKDDVLLFQAGVPIDKSPNIAEFQNNTLQVNVLTNADYGNYSCILMTTNDVKSRPTLVHQIVPPTPPVIHGILTNKNNDTVYKPGETLTLTCLASGYPKPTISWHKGNERLAVTGETLTIPNLTVESGGMYRCLADNQIPNQLPKPQHQPGHHYIHIKIEHGPKISVGQYLVTSNKEKDAELICTVDAYPQAKIFWKKGDTNIVNKGKNKIKVNRKENVIESILLITALTEEDFTNYTCFAGNSLGQTEEKINLVKVPVVREFSKPEKTNKDVVLTWKVESTSSISAHEIQYRRKGDTEWKVAKPEVSLGESNIYTVKYVLKDLEAGAYETRVRSMSEHGWSEYSEIVPFEGVLAKHGSSTHKNHHKKHQKEKELKEKHISSIPATTSAPQQQEIIQKEAPVGASKTGSSCSVKSSAVILSMSLILILTIRQ